MNQNQSRPEKKQTITNLTTIKEWVMWTRQLLVKLNYSLTLSSPFHEEMQCCVCVFLFLVDAVNPSHVEV